MSLQLKYTIFVVLISVIGIAAGGYLLLLAYRQKGKRRESTLAAGNILIAVFVAIASAFAADFFRPDEVDKKLVAAISDAMSLQMNAPSPALSSTSQCLDHWNLTANMWHYSLTRTGGSSVWQVGRPVFSRPVPNRIIGHGVWLSGLDRSRFEYYIEVGCRGKRGIWIFTRAAAGPDDIPTVEVYPELPESQQAQIIGYAIDQTWDEHEVLAPVIVSHEPLHGSQDIGPITDPAVNKRLSKIWRDQYAHHTAKTHECTVCTTLADVP